ncbi:MAG TPA: hypothetical protein VFS21_39710 [Roseiflexaceae bacterium]|nr:hypothetical protein [Roseiflexaceae bacterium]
MIEPQPRPFVESDLDPAELEQILRRIDENLELRPLLNAAQHQAGAGEPPLPETGDFAWRLQNLQNLRAPLFAIYGRGLRDRVKQALNLPIKLFGRKQIVFNRDLLELLQVMLVFMQDVRRSADYQLHVARQVQQHSEQIERLEQLARQVEQYGDQLRGTAEWITLLERKHQMLALDVRERLGQPQADDATLPEPQILDPKQYRERLAAMGDRVRVNLACGEKPWPDYINIDFRPVPHVDVIADVRRLPFEPGALAEIASAHLVEHFREHQLRSVVLPYWKQLLRPDGAVRIICPNWQAMLDRLQRGEMSLATFKQLTFGGQDYEGDDHFAMYTPDTLTAVLRGAGFQRIQVLATDRMNGLCPEMELLGHL